MLVNFTVGNFLSFKEKQTLSFEAESISEFRNDNIIPTAIGNLSVLKGAVLYGANASGKSNLFKALNFMTWFIQNSSKDVQAGEELEIERFRLSTETISKPSFFEIQFLHDEYCYRYGFEVDKKFVHSEWLYRRKKQKEFKLFERENQEINVGKNFNFDESLKDRTRKNALVLSVSAQFNVKLAISLIKKLRSIKFISGTRDQYSYERTVELLKDPAYKKKILEFIKGANLGFHEIETKTRVLTEDMLEGIPKEIQKLILKDGGQEVTVSTQHVIYDEKGKPTDEIYFDLKRSESLGTQKYFSLSGPITEALIEGNTLVIDEFDARLHPILSQGIVLLFNSQKNNPNNAQLIIATHNATLLSRGTFRRDQIVLMKKDKVGASQIETLFDLRIRKDASFEKDYLLGKYGAVPSTESTPQLNLFDDREENYRHS